MDKENFTFKRILVGFDESDDSILAFRYAVHQASEMHAQLILCSVMESNHENVFQSLKPNFVNGTRENLIQNMKNYEQIAKQHGVKDVKVVIGDGKPGEVIVKDIIPRLKPDLLIIGSKSRKGFARHFGSQAAYMVKYATIPVMVIR